MNPNPPANWLDDVERWRADLGVTYEHLSYEMGFWNVEGSHAYAAILGSLAITIKGQSVVRTRTLALRSQSTGRRGRSKRRLGGGSKLTWSIPET